MCGGWFVERRGVFYVGDVCAGEGVRVGEGMCECVCGWITKPAGLTVDAYVK